MEITFFSLSRKQYSAKLEIMATKLNSKNDISFEDSLKELEEILAQLENPQVPLSELVEKYGRARECLDVCRKRLDDAELTVKKLSQNSFEDFSLEDQ